MEFCLRGVGDQKKPYSVCFLETSKASSFGDDVGSHTKNNESNGKKASGIKEAFIRGIEQNAQFGSINEQNKLYAKNGFEEIGCNVVCKCRRKRFQVNFKKIASSCILSKIATFSNEIEWFEFICVSKYMFRIGDQCWKYVWKHDIISDYRVGCRLKRYLELTKDCVYNIMDNMTSRRIKYAAVEAIKEANLIEYSILVDVAKDYGFLTMWRELVAELSSI